MIRFQDGQNRIEMPEIDSCDGFRNIRLSSEISKTEVMDFWDDLFVNPEQKQEDFVTALLQDVYGRDEDDFTFDKNYVFSKKDLKELNRISEESTGKGIISFMTVEQVKGIEFDKVFVLPNKMSKNEKYIAYTRAQSELVILVDDEVMY